MIIDPSGAEVSWDYQVGTFVGKLGNVTVGKFGGDILSVTALETALGISLSAETGAALQEAYLLHPYNQNKRFVTKLQFMDLFRPESLVAIYDAAKINSSVQIELDRVTRAPNDQIELTDVRTTSGLIRMEYAGLIPAGDADRIKRGIPWQ